MCNLYAHRAARDRLKAGLLPSFEEFDDHGSNFPPQLGIYPDYQAPIVRLKPASRTAELGFARWGLPSPKQALEGKKTDPGVTNVRNTKSGHWRRWLASRTAALSRSPASQSRNRNRMAAARQRGSPSTRAGPLPSSLASG
jgi:putative SOS response-associated peptidase YedK